jgi:hypothetical protein
MNFPSVFVTALIFVSGSAFAAQATPVPSPDTTDFEWKCREVDNMSADSTFFFKEQAPATLAFQFSIPNVGIRDAIIGLVIRQISNPAPGVVHFEFMIPDEHGATQDFGRLEVAAENGSTRTAKLFTNESGMWTEAGVLTCVRN